MYWYISATDGGIRSCGLSEKLVISISNSLFKFGVIADILVKAMLFDFTSSSNHPSLSVVGD